ncbi:MAG TPA: (d)CMP kinase [Bacteroidia bacterium]|nr:(d)CMP kinase [Bacteroidia bacterium]
MSKITIAVDGYSSCGKSTLSNDLAHALGYAYIDTGAMYRAVTLYCIQQKVISTNTFSIDGIISALPNIKLEFVFNRSANKSEIYLNGKSAEKEIRTMEVASLVSRVSAIHEVRVQMVNLQREMGKLGGVVMDGRDIGTTVFPHAELKIFMTADENVRIQRRKLEMESKGTFVSEEEVRKNIHQRDVDDTTRKESPLRKADDALVLDNSYLTREEQLALALQWAKERM